MNATESLKDAESCVFNELCSARHQEEILLQHLHVYTVGTLNKGHYVANDFVPCREIVPISEVK